MTSIIDAARCTGVLCAVIRTTGGPRPASGRHRHFPAAFDAAWLASLPLPTSQARPTVQPVALLDVDRRGIADIAMDASNCSPVAVFEQPLMPGSGWGTAQGTSMSAPLFAALVADAAQLAGHRLGVLGPALYSLHDAASGIMDITSGTDAIPGMPGFAAGPGYDLPTGLGTVGDARQFTAAQSGASHAVPATAGPAMTAPLIGGRPLHDICCCGLPGALPAPGLGTADRTRVRD